MTDTQDILLAVSALDWSDKTNAHLPAQAELGTEALGALLAHVTRVAAGAMANAEITPVSITQDCTAPVRAGLPVTFETGIDRRTRTLIFANGRALQEGTVVMTLTGVFAIPRQDDQA